MITDSALADELLNLQKRVDDLDAERNAMYRRSASFEECRAKTKEYTEAYEALNDLARSVMAASDADKKIG